MITQTEQSLTVELAPRRLSQIASILFVLGGLAATVVSAMAYVKTHSGLFELVLSVLVLALGALVLSNTQGVYVVIDKRARTLNGELRPMVGARKTFEHPLSDAKEIVLAGNVNYVSVYVDFKSGDEMDSVLCGQFARSVDEKRALQVLIKALQGLVPSIQFVPRDELKNYWLQQ